MGIRWRWWRQWSAHRFVRSRMSVTTWIRNTAIITASTICAVNWFDGVFRSIGQTTLILGERFYDTSYFHDRVERVLIDDHNVPRLKWDRETWTMIIAVSLLVVIWSRWRIQWQLGSNKTRKISLPCIAKVAKAELERWFPLLCWNRAFVKRQRWDERDARFELFCDL